MRRTSTLNADALEKMMEKYGGVKKEVKGAEFISKVGTDADGKKRRIVCMIVNIRSYYQRTELLTNDETYCESCMTHTKNMSDEEQKCNLLKNVPREGESLEETFRRLDPETVLMHNPNDQQLFDTFMLFEKRIRELEDPIFLFAYNGHGVEFSGSIHGLLSEGQARSFFPIEKKVAWLAKQAKTLALFNCNRMIAYGDDPPPDDQIAPQIDIDKTKAFFFYAARFGENKRGADITSAWLDRVQNEGVFLPQMLKGSRLKRSKLKPPQIKEANEYIQSIYIEDQCNEFEEGDEKKGKVKPLEREEMKTSKLDTELKLDWAYKLPDMTIRFDENQTYFRWMVPELFLRFTPEEKLHSEGILREISFATDGDLSAIQMKFDNGKQVIKSPVFGEKNKIDTNYAVKNPIRKMTFVYSQHVHAVEFNDTVNIEGQGNMGASMSELNVKKVELRHGQSIVGLFGQFYTDTKNRKVVSWFSFIVTPFKYCSLSCCNGSGVNGIKKVPVMKRSQTKSYARHSMLLGPSANWDDGPSTDKKKREEPDIAPFSNKTNHTRFGQTNFAEVGRMTMRAGGPFKT